MHVHVLTLFPEYFKTPLESSMLGRAVDKKLVDVNVHNIRDFATDKHSTTDDRPYGGGAGMVMLVEPIDRALKAITGENTNGPLPKRKIVLTSAKGVAFTQQKAREYAQLDQLILICGHYEGVDQRVSDYLIDEEIRIGDYVLTGGEPAAIVVIDAVTRLLPGVLGNDESTQGESHDAPGVMGYPQYARPRTYNNWDVPQVLLGGDHQAIKNWREANRQSITEPNAE